MNKCSVIGLMFLATSASAMDIIMTGDNATVGSSAVDTSCDIFGEHSFTSDGSRTIFTSDESYSGNKAIRMTAPFDKTGFGSFGGIIKFSNCTDGTFEELGKGDEIWIRTRIMFPLDWEFNSGRNKFLRLRTYNTVNGSAASEGYNDLYIDGNPGGNNYTPFNFIFEGNPQWFNMGTEDDFFVLGEWATIEWYLYLDDKTPAEGGNAHVRVWKDGVLIGDSNEYSTLKTETSYITALNYFTYYGNEKSPKDQHVYVDDVVVTSYQPITRDSFGNPYIGIGEPSTRAEPSVPVGVTFSNTN